MSLTRATLAGILPYHFANQDLDTAIAAVHIGFCSGWVIVPAPASYLFTEYGFNKTMLMMAPLMLVHLLGVAFYSQKSKTITKEDSPDSIPLRDGLKMVVTNKKVCVWSWIKRKV